MRKTWASLIFVVLALFPAVAGAQVNLSNLGPNTVVGRQGIPAQGGPAQAIPFATLVQSLLNSFPNCNANTVFAGPSTGAAAPPSCRSLVAADIPPTTVPSVSYQTRALAVAASVPSTVNAISIAGYTTANDGGGGIYTKLASPPAPTKAWHFQSADGAWWQLVTSPVVPKQVGAKLDGSTDDSTAMQAWLDYGGAFGVISAGQSGTALIPTATLNLTSGENIDGRNLLTIQRGSNTVASLMDCNIANTSPQNNIAVRNTTFTTTAGFSSTSSNTIGLTSQTYTVPAGLVGLVVGNFVQITANSSAAARVNYEIAQITAYSGTTLTVTATTAVGSGTFAAWLIDVYPLNGDLAASNIALRFTACSQILAQGNTVTGRFYNAYDSRNGNDVIFDHNIASGYVNRGIHMAAYVSGNSASNNQATFNRLSGSQFSQYGINTSASDSATALRFLIEGNQIDNTTFQGIIVGGGITFSAVANNSVQMAFSSTGVGIIVEGLNGTGGLQIPQHITTTGNTIVSGTNSIFVQDVLYSTFSGNSLSAAGSSCLVLQGSTATDTAYNSVVGNTAQGCGANGIFVNGLSVAGAVTGNSVIGNTVIGNTTNGIASTANTSNNNYSGNVSLVNGTAYSIAGTGNVTTGGNL